VGKIQTVSMMELRENRIFLLETTMKTPQIQEKFYENIWVNRKICFGSFVGNTTSPFPVGKIQIVSMTELRENRYF
jgi:hypothetical protein